MPQSSSSQRLYSALLQWFLIDGSRWVFATGILIAILGISLLVALAGFVPVTFSAPFFYLYSAFLTGNLTLITVVLSINQLVLSRELGSVTDLEDRLQGAIEFREQVERDASERTTPITPPNFFAFVLGETAAEAEGLREHLSESADDGGPGDLATTVENFANRIRDACQRLERTDDSLISVLAISLGIDYSTQSHNLSMLRAEHEEALSEEATETIGRLIDWLRQIDIAQQYFKTVYVQEELAYLSKILLYVGLPVEVLGTMAILFVAVVIKPPAQGSVPPFFLRILVSVLTTVLFAPLVLLFVYVVRVATISRRTTPTSPFTIAAARSDNGESE